MKKQIFTLWVLIFIAGSMMAQESLFNKGDKVVNLGIGIGSTLYSGSYYTSKIPPLSMSFEMGVVDNFLDIENLNVGVGGYVGFSTYSYKYNYWGYNYGYNYTNIILGGRGTVHYPFIEKLDTYTGLLIGPSIVISREYGDWGENVQTASGSGIAWSYFIGGRYYFKENLALMVELGYGISYLNLGVAFKL